MPLLAENRALLDAFRRGEPWALGETYEGYAEQVAAFLRGGFSFASKGQPFTFSGFRSSSELQDTLQETFCRAFAEPARLAYVGILPYGPYLLTIARNLTIDHLRRTMREVQESVVSRTEDQPRADHSGSSFRDPEEALLDQELSRLIRTFCDGLSDAEREALRAYYLDERGQREAATSLGVTRHQLRKQIDHIRTRLQRALVKSGHLEPGRGGSTTLVALVISILAAWCIGGTAPAIREGGMGEARVAGLRDAIRRVAGTGGLHG